MAWLAVDVSPGSETACFRLAGAEVLMVRVEGAWLAVEDRCSHADCSFASDGEVEGAVVICNCHGSEFDIRTGAVLVGPALDPIRTFPIRENHGRLEVEL